jgi:hypothetical protein
MYRTRWFARNLIQESVLRKQLDALSSAGGIPAIQIIRTMSI